MLLISDREEAQTLPRIVGHERLLVCAPDEATAELDDVVIIDVDLADRGKRRLLRHLFGVARPGRSLAVAIDIDSPVARRAADRLGATALLCRPVTAGILFRFAETLVRDHGRDTAPLALAVTEGASALADAFSAYRNRTRLDVEAIRLVAADIADTVADHGMGAWLEALVPIHDGALRHGLAVAGIAAGFGRQIGMNTHDVTLLTLTGLLVDLGIAALPQDLVERTTPPSGEAAALLRRHPVDSHAYLKACSNLPEMVLDAVRHHHELLDGSGYPDGLTAGKISDLTHVLTVCDLFAGYVDRGRDDPDWDLAEALDIMRVMAREEKIATGHVAVLEAALAGRIGWPEEAARRVA